MPEGIENLFEDTFVVRESETLHERRPDSIELSGVSISVQLTSRI